MQKRIPQNTAADIDVVTGDARLTLAATAAFDVIVIDAFTSDAIPSISSPTRR